MKNEEVVAHWIAQDRPAAKTRNVWMRDEGLELFNYGARIGRMACEGRAGIMVALVSSYKYSDTTSVIQNMAVGQARNAGMQVFRVPDLRPEKAAVKKNLADYASRIQEQLDKLVRGRKDSADAYRAEASRLLNEALDYSRAFKAGWAWKGPAIDSVRHPKEEN